MRNIWLVAVQEFLINVRKKSFLFALFGVPAIMLVFGAGSFYITLMAEESGLDAQRIGVVDNASVIAQINDGFTRYEDNQAARAALDAGELDAFIVIPQVYISTGRITVYAPDDLTPDSEDRIEMLLAENLANSIESEAPPELLVDPVDMRYFMENTGRELTQSGIIGLFLTPMLFAVVLLMALQLSSTYLMSGVVEEKSNHIMEILITSITPYELLTGKLIGLGALGLLQILVWLVAAGVAFLLFGDTELLSSVSIPPDFLMVVMIYFFFTYFLYASVLAGIGAVIGSEQESRTYAGVISLLIGIPFFFFALLITNPDSPLFLVLQLFPFTAGMTYILRFSFTTVPFWQILVSIALLVVSSALVTWAAAKVFRWALLLYGKKPSPLMLWRVIRGQPDIGIMPDQAQEANA